MSVLNTIQEIRGSLTIERFEHAEFPYLSNLVTIGSDFNETFSFSCNNNSENRKYSILIDGTELISIDLSSLQEVNGGGVQLSDNPDLCYVGDFSYYVTDSSADFCLINQYRSSIEQCSKSKLFTVVAFPTLRLNWGFCLTKVMFYRYSFHLIIKSVERHGTGRSLVF